jgi:hypothetical protein
MAMDGLFGVCVWLGWLVELWWGPNLRLLGMSLRSEIPSQVSFWVAFRGYSFELTNGGLQCWGSITEG